jgi:hypothetical protein
MGGWKQRRLYPARQPVLVKPQGEPLSELGVSLDEQVLAGLTTRGYVAKLLPRRGGGVGVELAEDFFGCIMPAFNASGLLAGYLQMRYRPMIPFYMNIALLQRRDMGPGGPVVQNLRVFIDGTPPWELEPKKYQDQLVEDALNSGMSWLLGMTSVAAIERELRRFSTTTDVSALAALLLAVGRADEAEQVLVDRASRATPGDRQILEPRIAALRALVASQ